MSNKTVSKCVAKYEMYIVLNPNNNKGTCMYVYTLICEIFAVKYFFVGQAKHLNIRLQNTFCAFNFRGLPRQAKIFLQKTFTQKMLKKFLNYDTSCLFSVQEL